MSLVGAITVMLVVGVGYAAVVSDRSCRSGLLKARQPPAGSGGLYKGNSVWRYRLIGGDHSI